MRVSEWFYSVQGEGVTAGKPSLFLRFANCNFMSIGVKKGVSSPKVWTEGKSIPIQDLHVGDTILAVDENNQVVNTTVQSFFEYELDTWVEIIVERPNRRKPEQVEIDRFLCSPEHPWLTNRGWVPAGALQQTDEIYFVDYKDKMSFRMKGEKNPIHDPVTMAKHLKNTDWKEMGKTQAATISLKKEAGSYVGSVVRLRDLDPARYNELRQKHSQRMTENNPMHDPEVVRKSKGMHQNINEHYPYMSLSEKQFAEMCEKQGLPVEYVGRFDLPIKHKGKTHYPDFQVQGTNRLIEVYWDTGRFSSRNDSWKKKKLEAYRANGYECTFANFAVVPEVRDQVADLKEELLVHNGRTIRSIRKFKFKERWWDKEEGFSIAKSRLKAFDLTCAPYNTFIVDGLVTHNCGGFGGSLVGRENEGSRTSWWCLDGNTRINRYDSQKLIKNVEVGDVVMGFDERTQTVQPTNVIRKIEHTLEGADAVMYIIRTEDGTTIEANAEHPFYIHDKYVRASDLKVGDEIHHLTVSELRALQNKYSYEKDPSRREKVREAARVRDTSYMQKTPEYKKARDEGRERAGVYEASRQRMLKNNPMKRPEVVRKNWESHKRKSRMEEKLESLFGEAALPIDYTGDGSLWIAGKNPDFRIKDTRKVIEVFSSTFLYKKKDGSSYYRGEDWKKEIQEHYNKYGFEVLLLDMDREGVPSNRSATGHISSTRRDHLLELVGRFVHNGTKIVSIEKKQYTSKKVYNLECFPHKNFFANRLLTHNCDTEPVWKAGKDYKDADELMREILTQYPKLLSWIADRKANIIITGGEPTLPHNMMAMQAVQAWFRDKGIEPFYEVETNASIAVDYARFFQQVNASPKLANSGMNRSLRQNKDALDLIASHPNGWFKFVVNSIEDIEEIEREWVGELGIPEDRIILMPGVDNIQDLQRTTKFAFERAIERGWRATSRLQIAAWDMTTGR